MKAIAMMLGATILATVVGCENKNPPAGEKKGVEVQAPGVEVKTGDKAEGGGVEVKTPAGDVNVEKK